MASSYSSSEALTNLSWNKDGRLTTLCQLPSKTSELGPSARTKHPMLRRPPTVKGLAIKDYREPMNWCLLCSGLRVQQTTRAHQAEETECSSRR